MSDLPPPPDRVRNQRMVHASVLASIPLLYWTAHTGATRIAHPHPTFAVVTGVLGFLCALIAVLFPRLLPSTPTTSRSANAVFLVRWALAEAIAIFGRALDMQGAPQNWTMPFYAVAVVLLIVYASWYGRDKTQSK